MFATHRSHNIVRETLKTLSRQVNMISRTKCMLCISTLGYCGPRQQIRNDVDQGQKTAQGGQKDAQEVAMHVTCYRLSLLSLAISDWVASPLLNSHLPNNTV